MLQHSRRSLSIVRSFCLKHAVRSFASSTKEQKMIQQDHAHCVQLVQERDKEGYLCGLLMPRSSTRAYFALKAFNAEIAAIKDSASSQQGTSLALQLRMQWWTDAIDQIMHSNMSTTIDDSPVVRSLQRANQEFHFTRRFLERLIESRRADLDISQYETIDDLIQYAEDSVSSLLYLSLETLGVREDAADEVAYHAGVGVGLVTALRSIPYNLYVHENLSVPANVLRTENSRQRDDLLLSLLADDNSPIAPLTEQQKRIWDDAIREMVAVASLHLSKAQQLQTQVPRHARVAFLPVVPAMMYLSQLQEVHYHVLDPVLSDPSQRRLKLLFLLSRTWLTGVF